MTTTHAVGPGVQRLWEKGVIKNDRLKLEVSQKDIAKMLGVSSTTLRKWENGELKPTLEQMLSIYQTLRTLTISKGLV